MTQMKCLSQYFHKNYLLVDIMLKFVYIPILRIYKNMIQKIILLLCQKPVHETTPKLDGLIDQPND